MYHVPADGDWRAVLSGCRVAGGLSRIVSDRYGPRDGASNCVLDSSTNRWLQEYLPSSGP